MWYCYLYCTGEDKEVEERFLTRSRLHVSFAPLAMLLTETTVSHFVKSSGSPLTVPPHRSILNHPKDVPIPILARI